MCIIFPYAKDPSARNEEGFTAALKNRRRVELANRRKDKTAARVVVANPDKVWAGMVYL